MTTKETVLDIIATVRNRNDACQYTVGLIEGLVNLIDDDRSESLESILASLPGDCCVWKRGENSFAALDGFFSHDVYASGETPLEAALALREKINSK